jgi:hypothetical protein
MESSSMERAQFRLQQLVAHLHPEQGSLSFMVRVDAAAFSLSPYLRLAFCLKKAF